MATVPPGGLSLPCSLNQVCGPRAGIGGPPSSWEVTSECPGPWHHPHLVAQRGGQEEPGSNTSITGLWGLEVRGPPRTRGQGPSPEGHSRAHLGLERGGEQGSPRLRGQDPSQEATHVSKGSCVAGGAVSGSLTPASSLCRTAEQPQLGQRVEGGAAERRKQEEGPQWRELRPPRRDAPG